MLLVDSRRGSGSRQIVACTCLIPLEIAGNATLFWTSTEEHERMVEEIRASGYYEEGHLTLDQRLYYKQ